MTFSQAVQSVIANYLNPNGRARRSEYWYFALVAVIATVAIEIIGGILGDSLIAQLIVFAATLVVTIPMITTGIRRLHDIGKSGWFILITLIPVVGSLILIYFYVQDSQPGTNQYGPNPKGL